MLNFLREILKQFDDTTFTMVEIGCNSGALIFTLLDEFKNGNFTGIDLQKHAIMVANQERDRRGIRNAKFIEMDARYFSIQEPIDVLVTSATLIYFDTAELLSFLQRVIPFVKRAIIFNEISSKNSMVYKSHYYAHSWEEVLREPIFANFDKSFQSAQCPAWDSDNTKGLIIKCIRKTNI